MLSEGPAKKIADLDDVRKVGYKDYRVWILVEDVSDLLECERVPKKSKVEYNVVTKEKEIPVHVNTIE